MSILRSGHVALSNLRIKSPCCNSRVIQIQLIPGETGMERGGGGGRGGGVGGGGCSRWGSRGRRLSALENDHPSDGEGPEGTEQQQITRLS